MSAYSRQVIQRKVTMLALNVQTAERPTMLVVDDEVVVGISLQATLNDVGIDARFFHEALPALEAARITPFCAAIIDIGLPDMAGDQLARELRLLNPRLPIIFATGYGTEAYSSLLNDRLVRVLNKPFDEPQLIAHIRELAPAMQ